jgi:hypothetical protein
MCYIFSSWRATLGRPIDFGTLSPAIRSELLKVADLSSELKDLGLCPVQHGLDLMQVVISECEVFSNVN